jgi:hypothetical protein
MKVKQLAEMLAGQDPENEVMVFANYKGKCGDDHIELSEHIQVDAVEADEIGLPGAFATVVLVWNDKSPIIH